jgi:MFS family permease
MNVCLAPYRCFPAIQPQVWTPHQRWLLPGLRRLAGWPLQRASIGSAYPFIVSPLFQAANCGEIIGLFVNGFVSERFGYKRTVLACLIIMAGLIAIPVTANSVHALLAYYLLAGIPWGIWQTCT